MSQLTDELFGKRKRINPRLVNSYYEPYTKMINEQESIARDQMDPNSFLNQMLQNNMARQNADVMAQQNRLSAATGASQGVSGGQIHQMIQNASSQNIGNFGNRMTDFVSSQYDRGLGGLQNVMGMRQGEAERLSNMHIQNVNAANAIRQGRMNTITGLLGGAMKLGAMQNTKPNPVDGAEEVQTNLWGGSFTPFKPGGHWGNFGTGEGALSQWGQGGEGFMGNFGRGTGALSNMWSNMGNWFNK
jgi:hypothetical protein